MLAPLNLEHSKQQATLKKKVELGVQTRSEFHAMFLNIRSLLKKLDELELQIQGRSFDAI